MIRLSAVLLQQIAPLFFLASLAVCGAGCFLAPAPTAPTAPTSFATEPPHPIAIDGELAFGEVVVGQTRAITVTFRNTANRALILPPPGASINFVGLLSMSPPPARLEPGEATAFLLRFTPTAIGRVSGTFSVTAQSVTGEDVPGRSSTPISGTGVAPR